MKSAIFAVAIPLLGSLASAAFTSETSRLVVRQTPSESDIPAACKTVCVSAVEYSDECGNKSNTTVTPACLRACEQGTFNEFVQCFQCVADNTEGLSESEKGLVAFAVESLKEDCATRLNETVTGAVTVGGSITSAGASGASSTVTLGSPTSAPLSGSASAAASSGASQAASAASAASSAGSAAASGASAAASSAAPSSGAVLGADPLKSFMGGFIALVGVAAGVIVVA